MKSITLITAALVLAATAMPAATLSMNTAAGMNYKAGQPGTLPVVFDGTSVVITPNSAWTATSAFTSASSWVSHVANSGTSANVPNSTLGTTSFFAPINLAAGTTLTGTIRLAADDSADFLLYGPDGAKTVLFQNTSVSFPTCSNVAIGCLSSTYLDLTFGSGVSSAQHLYIAPLAAGATGDYTFAMTGFQRGGSTYGIRAEGTFETSAATPEPATLGVIGSALVGLATWHRRRNG